MIRAAACGVIALLGAGAAHAETALVERGRYLTVVGDCVACHTVQGATPFTGGRPIETPLGTVVAPNLTPDRATGIGALSDEQFIRAMQEGVSADRGHLYPAMPYVYYAKVSREDLLAIRAYLATLAPVRHAVVDNQMPFPLDIRAILIAWNALNYKKGMFRPDDSRTAEWNRGAYLVQGLGHCAACHTAKNGLGGDESAFLQGGVLQGWNAPDITGEHGGWSVEQTALYLKTGHNARAAASGPMAEVVELSTSHISDGDLRAIAIYLRTVPGSPRPPLSALGLQAPGMQAGASIYGDVCATCHAAGGEGVAGLFPALKANAQVVARDPITLLQVVLNGARSAGTVQAPTAASMPAFAWKLSDEEIANVTTYIRNAWGNAAGRILLNQVAEERKVEALPWPR